MALKLVATYSKKVGLPAYSSHSFSVTVEAEIANIDAVAEESANLYQRLQDAVDNEIQHTGFIPGHDNGGGAQPSPQNGSTHRNGNGAWLCSDKQKDLILRLIEEHHLEKTEIEQLSRDRFDGKGVKQLNKLEASGLIDELLERVGEKTTRSGRSRSGPPAYSRGGAR